MADQAKRRKQISRGQQAERLMDNKLLNEAFDKIERDIFQRWSESTGADVAQRERCHDTFQLLKLLKQEIAAIVQTGRDARLLQTLDEKQTKERP